MYMPKYVLFIPKGGFNDILVNLNYAIKYCKKHNRILLFDTIHSVYTINFNDYFDININNIIYDYNIIKNILLTD